MEVADGLTEAVPEVRLLVEKPPYEVQVVAFVDLQVSVEDLLWLMVAGLAESVAVGGESAHEFEFLFHVPLVQV